MDNKESPKSLHAIRHEIQWSNLALIILVTVLLSLGGAYINISANEKTFDQTLQNTAELISRQYEFTKELPPDEQIIFLDLITKSLTDVDRISIVNDNLIRLYHTDHSLIGKKYTGSIPAEVFTPKIQQGLQVPSTELIPSSTILMENTAALL